jgi:hypothetical protein
MILTSFPAQPARRTYEKQSALSIVIVRMGGPLLGSLSKGDWLYKKRPSLKI